MPARVNAGTLWGLAQRLVSEGMTFGNAWRLMREADFPTDRGTFAAVYQRASGILSHRRSVSSLAGGAIPTYESILDSALDYSKPYAYKVTVAGIDQATGIETDMTITQLYDRPVHVDEAITDALATVELDPETYELDVTGAGLLQVERSLSAWAPWLAGGVA